MTWINARSNLGGQQYPFLSRLGLPWAIHSMDIQADPDFLNWALSQTTMSLRYAKGGKLTDIYAQGLGIEEFLAQCGLVVNVNKGPFVTSKRLSRLFRPYFLWNFYDPAKLKIVYDDSLDSKLWDGAGQISRALLLSMASNLNDLTPQKRKYLVHELRTLERVEFTVMTDKGQDKGHAFVVDTNDFGLRLPLDTKSEVRLTDGSVFVGLMPVHSVDHMNLDVQSHINLWPFYGKDDIKNWLEAEAKLFLDRLMSGDVGDLMARIRSTDDLGDWWLRTYLASEGQTMWSASVVKGLAAQHGKKIEKTNLEKFKLPVPGGRYYLFADCVGNQSVPYGQIKLDPAAATAWVSSSQYGQIASVLGGADQDDALWIQPFTDEDNERKILIWRSPNQVGEWMLLEPSADCHTIEWQTNEQPIIYPRMDSSKLPARIDQATTHYEHLVLPIVPDPGPYTLEAVNMGIHQTITNAGGLGMLCNLMLVFKALYNQAPNEMPDYLSSVIDAVVKNGHSLVLVKAWIYSHATLLVQHQNHIPRMVIGRIMGLCGDETADSIVPTSDHWLDQIMDMAQAHLLRYQKAVQWIANQTMPPKEVFDQGQGWLDVAGALRSEYKALLQAANLSDEDETFDETIGKIAVQMEARLDEWPLDAQRHILMGVLTRVYLTDRSENPRTGEAHISDSLCFLIGRIGDDGLRQPGIADRTIEALRYFGILKELVDTPDGVMRYVRRPQPDHAVHPITINGPWFSQINETQFYARMGDVPPDLRKTVKEQIAEAAKRGRYNGQSFRVVPDGQRLTLHHMNGGLFGYIQKGQESLVVGPTLTIEFAVANDGNLHTIAR